MFTYSGVIVAATINAPIDVLWSIVSDVTRHPELAGSGEVMQTSWRSSEPHGKGSQFQSKQHSYGIHYPSFSRVLAWEPPYRFAWQVGSARFSIGQIWQFELFPVAHGTRVENSMVIPYPVPTFIPFSAITAITLRHEANNMSETPARLARLAGAPAPAGSEIIMHAPESILKEWQSGNVAA